VSSVSVPPIQSVNSRNSARNEVDKIHSDSKHPTTYLESVGLHTTHSDFVKVPTTSNHPEEHQGEMKVIIKAKRRCELQQEKNELESRRSHSNSPTTAVSKLTKDTVEQNKNNEASITDNQILPGKCSYFSFKLGPSQSCSQNFSESLNVPSKGKIVQLTYVRIYFVVIR